MDRLEGWKFNPDRLFLPVGEPKIPGMRKRKRKKRTFVKITCDDDVRADERGYWHYSWRQMLDDLDEPVVRCCGCWNLKQ